jgi:aspartyl/asparaginyl beta-hydroxylase (cupin superfamily)
MGIVAWLWYRNPYYLISWWNQHIKSECDQQDSFPMNGIPSFQNAWASNNKSVLEFHRLIHINHDEIYSEVMDIINNQNNFIESKEESSDLLIQRKWLKQENRWNPMWIRFMGDWSKISDKTPTLKRIASLFPEVTSLHISIFNPGTTIIENQGPSRSVHRYHYGLKIPEGDVGLKIAGYDVKWKEREGFIWDDTIPHSAWNHTSEPRIVIFADILRDLSIINAIGSRIIYSLVQRTKHVSQIKTQLQNN